MISESQRFGPIWGLIVKAQNRKLINKFSFDGNFSKIEVVAFVKL